MLNDKPIRLRFPKALKLASQTDFSNIFQRSTKRVGNKAVTAMYKKNSFSYPRIGIAVPKRFVRHAADRNRFKRIIREKVRQNLHQLNPVDVVILVRERALSLTKEQFQISMDEVCQKLIKLQKNALSV